MRSVLHVIDGSCDETALQVLATLHARRKADGCRDAICAIEPAAIERAARFLSDPIHRAAQRLFRALNYAPDLADIADEADVELAHAWGMQAAAVCSARLRGHPLVITLLQPGAAAKAALWLRSMSNGAVVAAGSQTVRTLLMAAGAAPERIVVIRGPVDFAAVNAARTSGLRERMIGAAGPVLLMHGPASSEGGQYFGLWASAIIKQVHRDLRVIVPYDSRERRRLERFVGQIKMPEMLVAVEPGLTWAQLATCADLFVCPAVGEICIEPIAAAMAAGLPIVGSANRSVTELIADKHNGLLCKPGRARDLAARILVGLEDKDLRRKVVDVARGQAYEVFGVRSFADNYERLYENVVGGGSIVDGIRDTAMVA